MELILFGDRPLATAAFVSMQTGIDALVIDATKLGFACPLDLAGIVATAHWAASCAVSVELRLPVAPEVVSYLQRMDVLAQMPPRTRIMGRPAPESRVDLPHRLLEVTRLSDVNAAELAGKLGRLISAYYATVEETAGRIVFRACGELMDNAIEHGKSGPGAFVAVQTYTGVTSGTPGFQFAVCDTGVGVLTHLRRNPKYAHLRDDQVALSLAVQSGVSGVSDDRGNGLADVIKDTRRHGRIEFQIRSGRGELTVHGTARSCRESTSPRLDQTAGTWASLTHELLPNH